MACKDTFDEIGRATAKVDRPFDCCARCGTEWIPGPCRAEPSSKESWRTEPISHFLMTLEPDYGKFT